MRKSPKFLRFWQQKKITCVGSCRLDKFRKFNSLNCVDVFLFFMKNGILHLVKYGSCMWLTKKSKHQLQKLWLLLSFQICSKEISYCAFLHFCIYFHIEKFFISPFSKEILFWCPHVEKACTFCMMNQIFQVEDMHILTSSIWHWNTE